MSNVLRDRGNLTKTWRHIIVSIEKKVTEKSDCGDRDDTTRHSLCRSKGFYSSGSEHLDQLSFLDPTSPPPHLPPTIHSYSGKFFLSTSLPEGRGHYSYDVSSRFVSHYLSSGKKGRLGCQQTRLKSCVLKNVNKIKP